MTIYYNVKKNNGEFEYYANIKTKVDPQGNCPQCGELCIRHMICGCITGQTGANGMYAINYYREHPLRNRIGSYYL